MKQEQTKIKYFLYARKSSESEDKQVLSIDSQIGELQKVAQEARLEIVEVLSESKSAKAPGRKVFNAMMERVYKGEAQGILCWKLDRLARNPVDGGQISWMIQQGVIKHIQTRERSYYPTDNVLMMSVEFGMANQFIRDLSAGVKRGLKTKAEMGVYPTGAVVGYMNDKYSEKGRKTVKSDPERFPLIRKMWDLMLTGAYNPMQILKIANEEWKFKMPSGKKLGRSTIYNIFSRPFYYGIFEYPVGSGIWHKGSHTPMITEEEYDKVQVLLGRKGKPRPKSHIFDFAGMMRCGECDCMITVEEKFKRPKNGKIHRYIYYHCTKRKNPNCSQGVVEEKELKRQIIAAVESLKIPLEFHAFAMQWFRTQNEKATQSRSTILASQQKAYEVCVKKLSGLIDMRAGGEISEGEFAERKGTLTKEKARLEELFADIGQGMNKWLDTADEMFIFIRDAVEKFKTGPFETRRRILSTLGSNLVMKDRILRMDWENSLLPIQIISKEVEKIYKEFEPVKKHIDKTKIERLYARNPVILAWRDAFRTYDWTKALPVPELAVSQIRQLLALA